MLFIGKRNFVIFLKRLIDINNIFSVYNFFKIHTNPIKSIFDEIFSTGRYPRTINFKTNLGLQKIRLYTFNDFSTFNLVFCRKDYFFQNNFKIILDIGSNIGVSALYWLTKNRNTIVYCYEPSSINFAKLQDNLKYFKKRAFLYKKAVSDKNFSANLILDKSGIYSSLKKKNVHTIIGKEKCKVVDINSCIKNIIKKHKRIDMVKIDNEGEEINTLKKINKKYLKLITCFNIDYPSSINIKKISSIYNIYRHSSSLQLKKNNERKKY